MTKQDLREYRNIKEELTELNRLTAKIEPHATEELRAAYTAKRESLSARLLHVEQVIEGLEPIERRVLRLRYIDGREWHQVAAAIHYSWQQTHRIHARALLKIKDK